MAETADGLAPSKTEIIDFCDRVLAKWSEDRPLNAKNMLAMNAVRTGVVWTDEATLGALWGEITEWMRQILREDARQPGGGAEDQNAPGR